MSQQQGNSTLKNRKGVEITTKYSHKEAFERLERYSNQGQGGEFAQNLIYRGSKNGLSEEQFWWVHKLVMDIENPPQPILFPAITNAFARAQEAGVKQRNMKTQIAHDDGAALWLSVAGLRSRHVGSIWVVVKEQHCETYCGRIGTDSVFYKTNECPEWAMRSLEIVEEHPVRFLPW